MYPTLDEAFYDINRKFLTKPGEMIQFSRGAQSFHEDLILKVKKPVTTINLHEFAFDPARKWQHLIRSYVEPENYWAFWDALAKVSGTSFQFRFKNKLTSNGPCLIAIVLTRNDSSAKWERAKIIWRTAELQRKWAADMVLIHNFFREIPEHCKDKVDIQEVSLYLAQAFMSWRLVGPLVEKFCTLDEVDTDHEFGRKVIDTRYKIYDTEDQPVLKFAPVARMQRHMNRLKTGAIPHSHPDDLSLADAVRKLEGRLK